MIDPTQQGAPPAMMQDPGMDPAAQDPSMGMPPEVPSAQSVLMQMFGIDPNSVTAALVESFGLQGAIGVIQDMLQGPQYQDAPETLNGPAGTESQALGDMPEQSTPVMRGGPYA